MHFSCLFSIFVFENVCFRNALHFSRVPIGSVCSSSQEIVRAGLLYTHARVVCRLYLLIASNYTVCVETPFVALPMGGGRSSPLALRSISFASAK